MQEEGYDTVSPHARRSERESGTRPEGANRQDSDDLMRRVTLQLGELPPRERGGADRQQLVQVLLFVAIVGGTVLGFAALLYFV